MVSMANVMISSSRVLWRNISPTPVRSHTSSTPNSRQMSEIVRSLGLPLFTILDTYCWETFIF